MSPKCDNVAHRGYSSIYPENTLRALREAIRAGATGCEFDVYGSKDGTLVLMHDKTVDRTTNGKGKVTQLTAEKLQTLDAGSWKDTRFAGEKVPTLVEALRVLKGTGCESVVEIKMEGISDKVIEAVRDLEMIDEVTVIAFSQQVVKEIRQLEPKLTCAWLCNEELSGTPIDRAEWLAERAKQCNTDVLDLNYKMLSPELVGELIRRGLAVWTWTVDDCETMQSLKEWGVQSITTNRPDLF